MGLPFIVIVLLDKSSGWLDLADILAAVLIIAGDRSIWLVLLNFSFF